MPDQITQHIAVTGSNGQLGHELSRLAKNHPDLRFTFLSRDEFPLDNPEVMKKWLENQSLDYFINCAAFTAVDKAESERDKASEINGFAPGFIAGILKKKSARLIQISTDYVFDGNSAEPLAETAATDPVNHYGATKLAGETAALQNNPATQIIRTSWVYSDYGNNFVKTMIRLMKERPSISVVDDQIGSPTWAGDLAGAIVAIIESGNFIPGIYHYSNEGRISWFEFASEIRQQIDSGCTVLPIPSSAFPTPAKRPAYSLMDKSKIKKDYGLAIPNWRLSLAKCLELLKRAGF